MNYSPSFPAFKVKSHPSKRSKLIYLFRWLQEFFFSLVAQFINPLRSPLKSN